MATRARGELEREIIACLAAADGPLTVQEVLDQLDGQPAYTTVMTGLSRLHEKRAVVREQAGRAYAYALPGGADDARSSMTAHRMHRLLAATDDRDSVLSRFVAELRPDDERALRRLLDDQPASGRRPGRRRPGRGPAEA